MRNLVWAAVAALALSTAADAQSQPGRKHEPAAGPFRMDAEGRCRAASGQVVSANLCPPLTFKLAANGKCYASNGRFVPIQFCKH